MFLRKKKNKSGSITVQIIEKTGRKNKILKVIGTTGSDNEIEDLIFEGKKYIELERILKQNEFYLSTEQVLRELKTIYKMEIRLPVSGKKASMLVPLTKEQANILSIFGITY